MPKSDETKQSRKAAVDYLAAHLPITIKAFPHLDTDAFTQELLDHINHPKHINQGKTDFCGPAGVLYALAKEDPLAYVKFALDLFVTGHASVRGWDVDASSFKNDTLPTGGNIGCCDWVTMAAVRTNVGFGTLTSVVNTASGTLPFEVTSAFKGMGYRDVRNETYSTIMWKADEKNLAAASALWQQGYRVILCVNTSMFNNADATSIKPNHFCTLKSKVRLANNISCRVWQWGKDHKDPQSNLSAIYVDLPKDQFIKHYFGYVAAGDRPAI